MSMITPVGFQTTLNDKLLIGDTDLPMSAADIASLTTKLGADGYVFLTVQDQVGTEVVKVSGACGALVVERGQDGTTPLNFPRGSCIAFRITPAVVRDMVCNTNCCEGDCCVPVTVASGQLPDAVVGVEYTAAMIFSGTLPIQIVASGVPAWLTASIGVNYIKFSGTPPSTQSVTIAAAATNCGTTIVAAHDTFTVRSAT